MVALQSGGGERVTVDLMNYFVQKGNEVTLVLMDDGGFYTDQISSEIRVRYLHTKKFTHALSSLVGIIKEIRPTTVFSSSMHTNVVLLIAATFSGVRTRRVIRVGSPLTVVFSRYTSWKDKIILPLLTKFFYRRSTKIIAVSKGIADDIHTVIGSSKNIVTIYNPKDIVEINKKSNEYVPEVFRKHTGPFILYVGRLVTEKDLSTLVEAFAISRATRKLHLLLVGDGGEKERIQKLVEDRGLSTEVSFVGAQENPYVYMKNSDVLVLPSLSEGLSNVLIEALITNVRIVATDCPAGGSREILAPTTDYTKRLIDRIEKTKSGALVPVASPTHMGHAILETLDLRTPEFEYNFFLKEHIMKQYEQALLKGIV